MDPADSVTTSLSPSQREVGRQLVTELRRRGGARRPVLMTGDVGTGKTYLARSIASSDGYYVSFGGQHLVSLLDRIPLPALTPEALIRDLRHNLEGCTASCVIADGFEAFIALWATENPRLLPNFFTALSRVVFDQPTLLVVQTSSSYLPHSHFVDGSWWPFEAHWHLQLTLADKEVVASNMGLDPNRALVANNLYELLAIKLERNH